MLQNHDSTPIENDRPPTYIQNLQTNKSIDWKDLICESQAKHLEIVIFYKENNINILTTKFPVFSKYKPVFSSL